MNFKKVDPGKEGQLLFELDNKCFIKDYDIPSRNVQEQVDYLKDSICYLAIQNNSPIGFFAYKIDEERVDIKSIAVLPNHQGKKYGKIMMEELLKQVKNHKVFVVTHPRNTPAIILYLKSGFEIYGWKDNYYGDGQPRLLLQFRGITR
jgi:ribosomal protein S18 acetylase RimI-like enzyme